MIRLKMNRLKLLAAMLLLYWSSIGLARKGGCDYNMGINAVKITEQLGPLGVFDRERYPESIERYFRHYGLDFADEQTEHIFGTFESADQALAGHIFRPKEYTATVFILHGYLNHSGQLKHLIEYLLEQNYAVAVYDMQGHGLSSGRRASIEDFSQYTVTLGDFVNVVREYLNEPYHLVGFSAGGGVALDYLLTNQGNVFDTVIVVAPLIRSVSWELSKVSCQFYSLFGKSIRRLPRRNSSDTKFLKFNRKYDYLHARRVPMKWLRALYQWNEKIEGLQNCRKSVKVIQGKQDTTVAWRYNVRFIREKFSDVEVSLIEKGRHELFNESGNVRTKVFSQISSFLADR